MMQYVSGQKRELCVAAGRLPDVQHRVALLRGNINRYGRETCDIGRFWVAWLRLRV